MTSLHPREAVLLIFIPDCQRAPSGCVLTNVAAFPGSTAGTRTSTPAASSCSRKVMLLSYRTVIETLQRIAWMLLAFFVAALVAYGIVRGFELRR